MEGSKKPEFFRRVNLEESEEVKKAVKRTEKRTGEKVEETSEAQIQNYLDRFQEILDREDPAKRERGIEALKKILHKKFVIKPDVATEVYVAYQKRQARRMGHGNIEISKQVQEKIQLAVEAAERGANLRSELEDFSNEEKQMAEEVVAKIEEQKYILDYWVNYLSGPDALYPDWLKYWAMSSVVELASYDKDEGYFPKRQADTINSFPDLNQQALAKVLDQVEQNEEYRSKLRALKDQIQPKQSRSIKKKKQILIAERIDALKAENPDVVIDRKALVKEVEEELGRASFEENEQVTELKRSREGIEKEQQDALDAADFAKLYAKELEALNPINKEKLSNTKGEWVKYDQGSDAISLSTSLQPYNTGWCTAGEGTARSQLSRGDFYVYYSEDDDGNNTIPRSAIRMEGNNIAEVRGIAKDQNLDPYMADIVDAKMEEFPDGKEYQKKAADMRLLTDIGDKMKAGTVLSKSELRFLYEIDGKIEGFGQQEEDPRIEEFREERDAIADVRMIYNVEQLNGKIAFSLLNVGYSRLVAENLEQFEGLDSEIAFKLIKSGEYRSVLVSVDKFESSFHKEIALKLIEVLEVEHFSVKRELFENLLENLDKFEGSAQKEIAIKLIEDGKWSSVLDNIDKFEGSTHKEIALKLIETINLADIINIEDSFTALLNVGIRDSFNETVHKFKNLDQEVALKLIEAGEGQAVAENLDSFQDLDEETLKKIREV